MFAALPRLIIGIRILLFDIYEILFRENYLYGRLAALNRLEFEEKVIFLKVSFPWGIYSQARGAEDGAIAEILVRLRIADRVANTKVFDISTSLGTLSRFFTSRNLLLVIDKELDWTEHLSQFNLEHLVGGLNNIDLDLIVTIESTDLSVVDITCN